MSDHHNLEYDLINSNYIVEKTKTSEVYAQNLYAALCNNQFQKLDTWPILKGQIWSCSWRYAGRIIASLVGYGDYLDWYCSGVKNTTEKFELTNLTEEQRMRYMQTRDFVPEGNVTDEIRNDLINLGWSIINE